jgi:hypothetical protein
MRGRGRRRSWRVRVDAEVSEGGMEMEDRGVVGGGEAGS